MPIRYKVIERGQPGVAGGGTKKFYATVTNRKKVNIRDLSKEIAEISTVSRADTIAVIESLLSLIPKHLANGNNVELGELGTFNITISSHGEDTAEKVTSKSIKSNKTSFRPGKEFQEVMNTASYEKVT